MRKVPFYERFFGFIRESQGKVVLIMHSQADPDAVGSAMALNYLINYINPELTIFFLEPNLSLLGQIILHNTGFTFDVMDFEHLKPGDLCIFIDTNVIPEKFFDLKVQIAIFDHHIPNFLNSEIKFDFRLEDFRATAEIMASLYFFSDISPTKQIVQGLLAGIIFDTRRFLYGDKDLFECVDYLLANDPQIYMDTVTLFTHSRSHSEKIACIKAAQRMKRFHFKEKTILFSHVSSYEAAAARSLISLGGDVALVIAARKNETRISIRTTPEFPKETGISIGRDVIPALIGQFGGDGGGHDGAAGYNNNITLEVSKVKDFCLQFFEELLVKKEV